MTKGKIMPLLLGILAVLALALELLGRTKIAGLLPIVLGLAMLSTACGALQEYQRQRRILYAGTAVVALAACVMALGVGGVQIKQAYHRPIASEMGEMYLQKATLEPQEKAIADLLGAGAGAYLLDYVVDDTVRTVQINTYTLTDGAWQMQSGGGGVVLEDTFGRIALTFGDLADGLRVAIKSAHDSSAVTYHSTGPRPEAAEEMSVGTVYLTDKTPVVYEQEIPLALQIHSANGRIAALELANFYTPERLAADDYAQVLCITVLFSQKMPGETTPATHS